MSSFADRSTVGLIAEVLDRKDRLRLGVSLVLILIGTILEMASLGIIIPVVQATVSGDRREDFSWLPGVFVDTSFSSFVQLLMLSLVGVFIVKNLFLLCSNFYQQRLNFSINNRIIQRLFVTYLRQPYEFHLINSSSVLVRNIQDHAAAVVGNGIVPLLILTSDVFVTVGYVGVLFLVHPVATGVLLMIFVLSGLLLVGLSRARIRRWGAERVQHRGVMLQALLAGFGGIKEVKVFGRSQQVADTHARSLYAISKSSAVFGVLSSLPHAVFEVMAVSGVGLLLVVTSLGNGDLQDTTVIIALFGVAAFRILPSANRFIKASQQLSFARAGIEGAVEGLSLPQHSAPEAQRPTDKFQQLEIRNLTYSYPNTEALVTNITSLQVKAGESVGIVGASGSGKSTLVDLLIGILAPKGGTILVNGRDIAAEPRYWQDRIGYVPQHVYLMDTTLRRNVAFGLPEKAINDHDVEQALRSANLWEFAHTLPNGLNTMVGERGVRLSGGQRQRLGIARALYGNPEVIVLDEATSALDTETEREIVDSLREIAHDRTLIVVAHRTSTLAYCNRLIRLEGGRIVQEGTFSEVVGSLPNA